MKLWEKLKKENWFAMAAAICIGVAFYMLLSHISIFGNFFSGLWAIVKPLLYGLIVAYLLDPIARFYQVKLFHKMKKQGIARKLSVILAIITFIVVLALLIVAVIPPLVKSIGSLVSEITAFASSLSNGSQLSDILGINLPTVSSAASTGNDLTSTISTIVSFLSDYLESIAGASASVGSGFINAGIAFILAIYYMMDKERLQIGARKFFLMIFKERRFVGMRNLALKADAILLNYIRGNLIEAFIVGLTNGILMAIFRMPYILLVSVVVGVTNLAPTFGPIVGAAIGALFLLLESPIYALIFLIFTVVIQIIDGYILKPKMFGDSFGVSSLLILISIILGGRIMGVAGILLAIPVAAILQFIADGAWKEYNFRRKLKEEGGTPDAIDLEMINKIFDIKDDKAAATPPATDPAVDSDADK
ncbi:MAG: AI-2E family transporter [Lachnospiraceae bacterium]|nr:AI-2E family transporter [Lachnospiraceae bacterium]